MYVVSWARLPAWESGLWEFYGAWPYACAIELHIIRTKYGTKINGNIRLKMSILQIWVTWASKITFTNLQLCSIKIKGSHGPCDITCSRSIDTCSNINVIALNTVPQRWISWQTRLVWDLLTWYKAIWLVRIINHGTTLKTTASPQPQEHNGC